MSHLLLLLLLVFNLPANAAESSLATYYYSSPQALFPSGQSNREDLGKTKKGQFVIFEYYVKNGSKELWIPAEFLALEHQVATEATYKKTNRKVLVLDANESQVMIQDENKKSFWTSFEDLRSLNTDKGLVIALQKGNLRSGPNWKSQSTGSYEPHERFLIKGFRENWIHVQHPKNPLLSGYIPSDQVLTKYDFSAAIKVAGQWRNVHYRLGNFIVTGSKQKIPIYEVQEILTKPNLAIGIDYHPSSQVLINQRYQVMDKKVHIWAKSQLPGHGEVYWKPLEKLDTSNLRGISGTITTDQILKKELYSVSVHPLNEQKAIASGEGVFLTKDGVLWNEIERFKGQNWPVYIDHKGIVYVGNLRSSDFGKSFQTFFQWEEITETLQNSLNKSPRNLKLTQIKSNKAIFEIHIDVQGEKFIFATKKKDDSLKNWTLISRSQTASAHR